MTSTSVTVIFLLLFSFPKSETKCNKTFEVFCDIVNDYLNYPGSVNWRQITIGSEKNRQGSIDSFNCFFDHLPNVEILTVINQKIDEECFHEAIDYRYKEQVKYLNFYSNDFEVVDLGSIMNFKNLTELNIVNCNVVEVEGTGFYDGEAALKLLNFAENRIREIKTGTFYNIQAKKLDLSHNKIIQIRPKSFNSSMEYLNLDFNDLGFISQEIFATLPNLKEFTISHNKLTSLSGITALKMVQRLDFSFNQITVEEDFRNFKNLNLLDLSYNKLANVDILMIIPENPWPKKISLAFNQITQFEYFHFTKYNLTGLTSLILFGNPLICKCADKFIDFFNIKKFVPTPCEMQLKEVKVPYCVVQSSCHDVPNYDYISKFQHILETVILKNVTCDLKDDLYNATEIFGPCDKCNFCD